MEAAPRGLHSCVEGSLVRPCSMIGIAALGFALACTAPPKAATIPMAAFPAPVGLEGMRTRIPVDLSYATAFVRMLAGHGIVVREVAHVRPGDFFANTPQAVRLVTALGDAEVMFVPAEAAFHGDDRAARDTSAAPARQLYFVARRDVFVVTGSIVLYEAVQIALRSAPAADS